MTMPTEYNRNPYDVDLAKITLEEVFHKWSERNFPKMSNASVSALNNHE